VNIGTGSGTTIINGPINSVATGGGGYSGVTASAPNNASGQHAPTRAIRAAVAQQPAPSYSERYIDPKVYRVASSLNVAIAVQGLSHSDIAPLEGVIRTALQGRGYSVVPIFRESFRTDGLGQRLFDGDPSLASRLKLQQHCDALVLGALRFVGPAQAVGGGLYIREVVLDVRKIDPASGQPGPSLEIREKGGGASAELSTINALSRLEDKVEASISEWSWT
jgi:hypothetical protein